MSWSFGQERQYWLVDRWLWFQRRRGYIVGVRPPGPGRHTLQVVLLEGHLPQERVEIVRFQGFDRLVESEDLAQGQPWDSQ